MAKEACGEEVQVKILGSILSPFVLRVCIACTLKGSNLKRLRNAGSASHVLPLKGIDYELFQENHHGKSPLLLKSNPVHKKIPVLIHNGKPVCESMIIVQYIDETWDKKATDFLPKDPYDRAIVRFWVAFVDEKLFPCLRGVFVGQGEQQQIAVEEYVANLLLIEEALQTNSCFSGKAYFGGDGIGLLDIALGGMLSFLKALQKVTDTVLVYPEKMPLLSAWMERFCNSDGVKEVMPDPAKHLEVVSAMRASFTSPPPGN